MAKDDYSCVMRVLLENFSENIRDQIPEGFQGENYNYRQETQEKEEEKLRDAVIKKQKGLFYYKFLFIYLRKNIIEF